jgi:hypothetical protein
MNNDQKRFYVASEGASITRWPMPKVEAVALIRFLSQAFANEWTKAGRPTKPEEVPLELIDTDSDQGRGLAEAAARRRQLGK